MGRNLEAAIGVLNGAIGDYLARTKNGLATPMQIVVDGAPISVARDALARAFPSATPRIVVLVHGLMCTETIWDLAQGGDYGSFLARDFGFTPVRLRYNTGLSIPANGEELAQLLARLVDAWPVGVEEILLLGFSMGGLVARAACHVASVRADEVDMRWLSRVRRAIYVGTPHLGAPYERFGRVLAKIGASIPDPFVQLAAQLGDLRSDGIKDLGDADLRHEDRARRRPRISLRDAEHPVPLLPTMRHYLVAGTLSADPTLTLLFGDSIVPLPSGTNGVVRSLDARALPPSHVRVFPGFRHMMLPRHLDVYAQIRAWCAETDA